MGRIADWMEQHPPPMWLVVLVTGLAIIAAVCP
jgi:hypothetical protein